MKTKLIKFLNSVDFGIKIANDYYGGVNQYYIKDSNEWHKALNEAANTIQEIGTITEKEIIDACHNAFAGRLNWDGKRFSYTAGQFYDQEIPFAVLSVAKYIKANR
jgi:hypothetical protein